MKLIALLFSLFTLQTLITQQSLAADFSAIKKHNYLLLIDQDSKEILLSKNSNARMAPSSMTKLMTAYVVFDQIKQGNIKLDNYCVIGKDAWRKRGSTMFLNYGDIVSINKLVKGLLTVSGNDASVALAQAVGKDYDNFIALMNFKAKDLGMNNSKFQNPHGLNEDGHYMSLNDLAILISSIYEDFPEYSSYLGTKKFTYKDITQYNRNPLIKKKYRGVIGGKTGHTNDGGYGIVASVTRGNRTLAGVINKARTSHERNQLIAELFDFGFEKFHKVELFKKDEEIAKLKTWIGEKELVSVATNKNVAFNIPKSINIDDIKVTVNYDSPVQTPIYEGKKIASLEVQISDYKTVNYPLFATEDIRKARFFTSMSQKIVFATKRIIAKIKRKTRNFDFFT